MKSIKIAYFCLITSVMLSITGQLSGQTLSLSVDQELVNEAGGPIKATLSRFGDSNESLEIELKVSDDTVLYAPSKVSIEANETSAIFNISIVNDGLIDGEQSAILTAEAQNYTSSAVNITVTDDDTENLATISGHLYGTLLKGEYDVIDDIIINTNRNLTIEPNTVLKFRPDENINVKIYGSFNAIGKSNEQIFFISSSPLPQPGDWKGIFVLTNKAVVIDNAYISDAEKGISIEEGNIDNVTITRSKIINNLTGIFIEVYTSGCDGEGIRALVKNSEIAYNTQYGVHLIASADTWWYCLPRRNASERSQIVGNYIHHNGYGIYGFSRRDYYEQNDTSLNETIINNLIVYNFNSGIYLGANSRGYISTEVYNNTIAYNGSSGIAHSTRGYQYFKIVNNIINDNKYGIRSTGLFSIDEINNCTIQFNNVFNNINDSNSTNWINYPTEYGDLSTTNQNGTPADLEMNISIDPMFANLGYWTDANDPNIIVERDDPNAVWIDGDYHLKSEVGRWDPNNKIWVADDVTSPCIDAGDPDSDWSDELWQHGGRINMGAYGGTAEASMSLSEIGDWRDLNNDNLITWDDIMLLADKWDSNDVPLKEDLDLNGIVDVNDLAFYNDWSTDPNNTAPVIDLIEDQYTTTGNELSFSVSAIDDDGDDLTYFALGLPDGSIYKEQMFIWTPEQVGTYLVTFLVSDYKSLDYLTVQFTVEDQ